MFNQIKTSASNKVLVTELTRKFGLGAENVIARIAIFYSLHSGARFSPLEIKDSGGKEYSKSVLFGNLYTAYLYVLCIIAKTKCAKIENETSKTSLFFASFFLLASGFVKCKLNAD